MSVLDGQASALDVGAWPFGHHIEDLRMCGVHLAREQEQLFNAVVGRSLYSPEDAVWAMTVEVITDPDQGMDGSKALVVWRDDEDGDPMSPELLLVPRLVRLDWDLWPDLDVLDPGWRRFPSLPGRRVDEECQAGTPEAFRLWSLWPVDYLGQQDVGDAYSSFIYSDWMLGWDSYLQIYQGVADGCAQVHEYDHPHHDDPLLSWGCDEGKQHEQELREAYVYVDQDGMEHWKAPPANWYSGLNWPYNEHFDQLLGYAERNAWASLRACQDPDAAREDEKRYSPWLWSY